MVDFRRDVFGWAGALETSVYGKRLVAARGAEGVSGVPVEEVTGFGVDGSCKMLVTMILETGIAWRDSNIPSSAGKLRCILTLLNSNS